MTSPIDSNDISDDRLVAYIDGELAADDRAVIAGALAQSSELRERLDVLDSGGRRFAEAFDLLLLAAPEDRLRTMLAGLMDEGGAATPAASNIVPLRPAPRRTGSGGWRMAAAAALALVLFGGGIATGLLVERNEAPPQVATQRSWMDAVAQYVSLYSDETLAGLPADTPAQLAALRRVSTALGIDISHDKVAMLPSLDFRGAQVLRYEGRPLAQIMFQSDTGKPVAICIIRVPKPAEPLAHDQRQGLNAVHWVAGGFGYIVIGDLPPDALTRISEAARARLS